MGVDAAVLSDFGRALRIVGQYQDVRNLQRIYWGMDDRRKERYIAHTQKLAAEQPEKFPLFVKLTLEYTIIRMEK